MITEQHDFLKKYLPKVSKRKLEEIANNCGIKLNSKDTVIIIVNKIIKAVNPDLVNYLIEIAKAYCFNAQGAIFLYETTESPIEYKLIKNFFDGNINLDIKNEILECYRVVEIHALQNSYSIRIETPTNERTPKGFYGETESYNGIAVNIIHFHFDIDGFCERLEILGNQYTIPKILRFIKLSFSTMIEPIKLNQKIIDYFYENYEAFGCEVHQSNGEDKIDKNTGEWLPGGQSYSGVNVNILDHRNDPKLWTKDHDIAMNLMVELTLFDRKQKVHFQIIFNKNRINFIRTYPRDCYIKIIDIIMDCYELPEQAGK